MSMFLSDVNMQCYAEHSGNTSIHEQDWHFWAAFWHPIACLHELDDKPLAAKFLDVKSENSCATQSTGSLRFGSRAICSLVDYALATKL